MRKLLALCSALLLLAACGKEDTSGRDVSIQPGTPKEQVLSRITEMNGTILRQTESEVLAEMTPPDIGHPIRIHLIFVDGVLDRVYYPPAQ